MYLFHPQSGLPNFLANLIKLIGSNLRPTHNSGRLVSNPYRGADMSKIFVYPITALICLLGTMSPANAQTSNPTTPRPRTAKVQQEPCWQKVGISKDVIDQREQMDRDRDSQIQSVCSDTSMTPQQKKQKIHEIRQETKQKVSGLISEQQQQELEACHKERGGANHPAPAGGQRAGAGPCGELTSPNGNHPGGQ
jgi:hypothetical protein